jgi:glycosyltransferase involved in cell wall biosynthesis
MMRKLIVVPGGDGIGGTTVTLSLMIEGFAACGASEQLTVLVRGGSDLEQYLSLRHQQAGLQIIPGQDRHQFGMRALQWVNRQPRTWPLFLDNWTAREVLPSLAAAIPTLRLSDRPIYHFFHDPAHSDRLSGYLTRKLLFWGLSPVALCNSRFTATTLHPRLLPERPEHLYQPVNLQQFGDRPAAPPPEALKTILATGAKMILTPSRIGETKQFNDKNLRGLVDVIAHLKALGHHYHSVIVGRDYSPDRHHSQALFQQAQRLGVSDRLTLLPATFSIQDYYPHAALVVTLAPREPFGRTVVEAIACGVTVVGSRTGGVGEILNHFAPEWTVDPFDPAATARAIVRIAQDPQTPHRLARGRRWVEQECSPIEYARKIIEIVQLASKPLPQPSERKAVSI